MSIFLSDLTNCTIKNDSNKEMKMATVKKHCQIDGPWILVAQLAGREVRGNYA